VGSGQFDQALVTPMAELDELEAIPDALQDDALRPRDLPDRPEDKNHSAAECKRARRSKLVRYRA
jgi:hypothetical protein